MRFSSLPVARPVSIAFLALCVCCADRQLSSGDAGAERGPAAPTPEGDRGNSPRTAGNAGFRLMRTIQFGTIRIGLSPRQVEQNLGPPAKKSPPTFSPATGEYSSAWNYPGRGIELVFDAPDEKAPGAIGQYTLKPPCMLVSAGEIGIGSTRSDIEKRYGNLINRTESSRGKTLVLGSVYGGVIFTLEKGKVISIFVGAAAE